MSKFIILITSEFDESQCGVDLVSGALSWRNTFAVIGDGSACNCTFLEEEQLPIDIFFYISVTTLKVRKCFLYAKAF